jgi:hypothetical protein
VGIQRRALGIAPFNQKTWKERATRHTVVDPARLLARRLELNQSQTSIGERAGMREYYNKVESGIHVQVTRRTLERIAHALETTPEKLIAQNEESL